MTDDVQGFLECPCYISYTQNADECYVRLGDIDLKVGFKGEVRRINVSDTWKKKINYSLIHAICIIHEDDLGCLCKTWTTRIV